MRVKETRFEMGQDAMEQAYDRITFGEFDKEIGEEEMGELSSYLTEGGVFLKYCRQGGPKQRRVFVRGGRVYWCSLQEGHKQDEKRSLALSAVTDIYLGCTSTEVMRNSKVPLEFDSVCFSL